MVVVLTVKKTDYIQEGGENMPQKKNLRKLQLIQDFLEKKDAQNTQSTIIAPTKEELSSEKCYFDYSPPQFKGDVRLSCQHKTRSGELQHREFILIIKTNLLDMLGREKKLRGKALEDYYEKQKNNTIPI